MKFTVLILSLLTVFSSFAVEDNNLTPEEKKAGWQLLFNGKDMSEWRNFKSETVKEQWKVKDGTMGMTAKKGGDIMTKKQYEDFDFRMEWKISEGGNSGIFILADELGKKIYSHAPEIQILDNERHKDKQFPSHRSGSLYDMIVAKPESQKKAGEWNQVRILLNKGHLQVWQNAVLTVDIVIGSEKWNELKGKSKFKNWKGFGENKKGHIGLQDHNDVVFFKNLKIRELK